MTAQAPFVMITAPAKINLYLGVHPERDERGYHKVDSVMTCIDLADTVAIAPGSELMRQRFKCFWQVRRVHHHIRDSGAFESGKRPVAQTHAVGHR